MFGVIRPLLKRLVTYHERFGQLTPDMLALVLVGILASSWVAEEIGIHFIFGAFVFGVIMPRKGAAQMTHEITDRLEQVSVLLLLPVFFVVTGSGVDIGAIDLAGPLGARADPAGRDLRQVRRRLRRRPVPGRPPPSGDRAGRADEHPRASPSWSSSTSV